MLHSVCTHSKFSTYSKSTSISILLSTIRALTMDGLFGSSFDIFMITLGFVLSALYKVFQCRLF